MKKPWLASLRGSHVPKTTPARRSFRPCLEVLEDRAVPAGLVVNDQATGGQTPTSLVNALLGAGVTPSNITFTGDPTQGATFSGGTGIIGFESGIILSTGMAKSVIGPNTSDSTTTDFGNPGDPQLDAIVAPGMTHDATNLSFDFIPQGNVLKFNFVFSSEEYNEFVDAGFTDVFAFFLNGTNVALLPGTSTPINIDTVNLTTNSQYYINNALPTDPDPATPPLLNTEMDGLTVVLPVVANVNPGVINHIKLAIADTGDGAYDSNVFINGFSAPLAPKFDAYRPLRVAFRNLEQNLGNEGPTPIGGTATYPTFDGNVTLINVGTAVATGPLQLEFTNLPKGVTIANPNGFDVTTGLPFINIPASSIPIGSVVRVPVKFSDPNHLPLGTFFVGPPDMTVTFS